MVVPPHCCCVEKVWQGSIIFVGAREAGVKRGTGDIAVPWKKDKKDKTKIRKDNKRQKNKKRQ